MNLLTPLGRLSDIGQARGASNNEVSSTPHCGALWNECIMMKPVEMPSNNHPWYHKDSQKFHYYSNLYWVSYFVYLVLLSGLQSRFKFQLVKLPKTYESKPSLLKNCSSGQFFRSPQIGAFVIMLGSGNWTHWKTINLHIYIENH